MVSSTMTAGDALDQLRPLMSDDFLRAWRRVTLALGYRTVGKAVATVKPNGAKPTAHTATLPTYCPTCAKKAARRYTTPHHRWTKTETREHVNAMWCGYVERVYGGSDGYIAACEARGDFRWRSYRVGTSRNLDDTDKRLALYVPKKCCGVPMGIMESWDMHGKQAVYQCAVNGKHTQPAIRKEEIRRRKASVAAMIKRQAAGSKDNTDKSMAQLYAERKLDKLEAERAAVSA